LFGGGRKGPRPGKRSVDCKKKTGKKTHGPKNTEKGGRHEGQ